MPLDLTWMFFLVVMGTDLLEVEKRDHRAGTKTTAALVH